MWGFASNAIKSIGLKRNNTATTLRSCSESSSDDDVSSNVSRDDSLDCPVCWESFNIVENVPYVLWCGHTLCKNCVFGLQCAVLKFHTQQIQFPFLIFCPWCHMISPRIINHGSIKFPYKNFFLLWMVENINGDRARFCGDNETTTFSQGGLAVENQLSDNLRTVSHPHYHRQVGIERGGGYIAERRHFSFHKSLDIFIHFTSKFPLVIVLLLIVFFVIPGCGIVLAIYFLLTALFAIPSLLILYFTYPALEWLIREITSRHTG